MLFRSYKVGEDPRWLDGLNILGELGVNVALIPHYNNAEGGDPIGQAFAQGALFLHHHIQITADMDALGDAPDHPLLALGQGIESGIEQMFGQLDVLEK